MPDREWIQSERRAENPGIQNEEDELRLDSSIQIRSTQWNERRLSSLVLLARRSLAFHQSTLRESWGRGGRRRKRTAMSKGRW